MAQPFYTVPVEFWLPRSNKKIESHDTYVEDGQSGANNFCENYIGGSQMSWSHVEHRIRGWSRV